MHAVCICLTLLIVVLGNQASACPSNSNADAGNGCVCNTGYVQKGKECVLKHADFTEPDAKKKSDTHRNG